MLLQSIAVGGDYFEKIIWKRFFKYSSSSMAQTGWDHENKFESVVVSVIQD